MTTTPFAGYACAGLLLLILAPACRTNVAGAQDADAGSATDAGEPMDGRARFDAAGIPPQCSGASCAGAKALGDFYVLRLALGPSSVFASNLASEEKGILRFDKALTSVTRLTGAASAVLATDATHVYYAVPDQGILRIAQAGGAEQLVVAGASPEVLAVDDTSVYWAEVEWVGGNESGSFACRVFRAEKTGGLPTTLAHFDDRCDPRDLLPMADGLYFLRDVTLMRAPFDGSVATPVPTENDPKGAYGGLAHDDRSFYLTLTTGTILSVPIQGGSWTIVAEVQPYIVDFVAVGESLYWLRDGTSNARELVKMTKAGGPELVLATRQRSPDQIVVDDTNVYWFNAAAPTNLSQTRR